MKIKKKNQTEDNEPSSPALRIKKDINDRISNNLISFTEHQEQNQIEEQQPLSLLTKNKRRYVSQK